MPDAPPDADELDRVLDAWSLAGSTVTPIEVGLINRTYRVDAPRERFVLQRLHPVFGPSVNADIEALTAVLAARGVHTPRIVRTRADTLFHTHEGVWRLLTFVEGRTVGQVSSPTLAREAAGIAARFHGALQGVEYAFQHTRAGVHDTAAHRRRLIEALERHPDHRLYDVSAPMAARLLASTETLPDFTRVPARISHGDLKISNVMFDEALARATALVDLDTMAWMPLAHEMGDALRSWCNPSREDVVETRVELGSFAAAMEGYAEASRAWIAPEEPATFVSGMLAITTELAMRFLADALVEQYFGWDPLRFATRGDHNLARARGQYALAQDIASRRGELERIVAEAFAPRR